MNAQAQHNNSLGNGSTRGPGAPSRSAGADPEVRLTLTDIIRALGKDGPEEKRTRSVLSRYLDDSETAALLGASGPVRPTFPMASVPVFEAILAAGERGDVSPKTAAFWLTKNFPVATVGNSAMTENSGIRNSENGLSVIGGQEVMALAQTMQEFIAAVKDLAPVREDSTLNRHQAAVLLTCAPSSVSRFVRPLRRGVYRRSDVMRYIASGVPQWSSP